MTLIMEKIKTGIGRFSVLGFLVILLNCNLISIAYCCGPDLSISSTSGTAGQQAVTVNVTADFDAAYSTVGYSVTYDTNLLTYTGIATGSGVTLTDTSSPHDYTITGQDNSGTVIVSLDNIGSPNMGYTLTNSPGCGVQIATMTFNVKSNPGAPTITPPNLKFSNVNFDAVTVNSTNNGTFTLTPSTPSVNSLTVPSTGTVGQSVSLSAGVTESGNGTISSVVFTITPSVGSAVTCTSSSSSSPYTCSWTPSAIGTYTINATATDSNTNQASYSSAASISISAAPTPSVNSLTVPATGTINQAVSLSAGVTESGSGTISSVVFIITPSVGLPTNCTSTSNSSPYTCSWAPSAIGNYSINVTATDNHGTQASYSSSASITINGVPAVTSLTVPSAGTVNQSVSLSAGVTESGSATISSVVFTITPSVGAPVTCTSSSISSPYTCSWTPSAIGTYTINATATDSNTNQASYSSSVRIMINAQPYPSLNNFSIPSTGIEAQVVSLSTGATETGNGTISSVVFTITPSAGAPTTCTSLSTSSPYTCSWTPSATGTYSIYVTATDNFGSTVNNQTSPSNITISTVPVISIAPSISPVAAGSPETFTATVSGSPAPNLQWKVSTNGGKTFSTISNQTGSTYTISAPNVTASIDQNVYECVAQNIAGTTTSNTVTLTVHYPPTLITQPTNQSAIANTPASFTFVAAGDPAPTYQWYVDINDGKGPQIITGANSSTYNIPLTALSQNGYLYQCVALNSSGTLTSNSVTLTVTVGPIDGRCGPGATIYPFGKAPAHFVHADLCYQGNEDIAQTPPSQNTTVGWHCRGINNGKDVYCLSKQNARILFRK